MLVCKSRGTVDQNLHFDDPPDEVEVTDGYVQRGDQLDGHTSGGLFPLFDGEIRSKLALPGLAVPLGDVAGHKHQCPNARKWNERRDRLRQIRQLDLQPLQCLVYRQTALLKTTTRILPSRMLTTTFTFGLWEECRFARSVAD